MFVQFFRFWSRCRAAAFTALCRTSVHRIGSQSILAPPIRLEGEDLLRIGDRVFVGPNSWLEVLRVGRKADGPVIDIGDETSVVRVDSIPGLG